MSKARFCIQLTNDDTPWTCQGRGSTSLVVRMARRYDREHSLPHWSWRKVITFAPEFWPSNSVDRRGPAKACNASGLPGEESTATESLAGILSRICTAVPLSFATITYCCSGRRGVSNNDSALHQYLHYSRHVIIQNRHTVTQFCTPSATSASEAVLSQMPSISYGGAAYASQQGQPVPHVDGFPHGR